MTEGGATARSLWAASLVRDTNDCVDSSGPCVAVTSDRSARAMVTCVGGLKTVCIARQHDDAELNVDNAAADDTAGVTSINIITDLASSSR